MQLLGTLARSPTPDPQSSFPLILSFHFMPVVEQESGRAGRDNLPATCILLYSYSDYVSE